ncbi:cell division control protein Cdc6 [Polychaeton citri CBS 116435]|uniref:Cell division control protein n=1 Tax=Polychaeton citri CBS 116435 TaxID=1314669 RepID=A0A9P4QIN3_9PEZI|nr:cell division control protein Cdc6 [Polychaeton citri CBS 116435]
MAGTVLGKRTRSIATAVEPINEANLSVHPAKKTRCATRSASAQQSLAPGVPSTGVTNVFKQTKAGVEPFSDEKENAATPRTPRHRDALAQKVTLTPRHRVLVAGTQRTPKTPRTPRSPLNGGTAIYNQARQLFSRCAVPGKLVGRDAERAELSKFVNDRLESSRGGCVYVSGPPGTGKSALVNEVIEQEELSADVSLSFINCMSIRNCRDLSGKLSEDLDLKEDAGFTYLKSCFLPSEDVRNEHKYLVVLDEVDRLLELDLALLYSLFEWSLAPSSRLVLIGIANALDLTDRFLPRLKSRNLKPDLLPFMPYTASQVTTVLTEKLRTLAPSGSPVVPFMQAPAIAFCSKKVASQTGDLRRAFDICRRAIDLVEQETRARDIEASLQESPSKTPLMENVNLSSPPSSRSPAKKTASKQMPIYSVETAPKATIVHVSRVTSLVFGNGTTQRLGTLNLQQKAVLCALAALEKRKRNTQVEKRIFATPSKRESTSSPTIKELYEAYSILCKREHLLSALSSLEFREVVSGLETLGLVEILDGNGRNRGMMLPVTPSRTPSRRNKGSDFGTEGLNGDTKKVASVIGYKELSNALDGHILEGDAF